MRTLRDIKLPDFKFPKIKFDGITNNRIDELTNAVNRSKAEKKEEKGKKEVPEPIRYDKIRDMFLENTVKYKDNTLFLQKFDHKGNFEKITYGKFRDDVIGFGTGIIEYLGLKDEKVVIISETTYEWYVSYMALLCGGGIAVPMDKELPENEFISLVERSKAKAIIFSARKKDLIEKTKDKLPNVKYFVEMYKDDDITNNYVGMDKVIDIGKKLYENGNNALLDTKIDKDEFKVLIFTSGTTSQSKGVMICNRNLADNVWAAASYVCLTTEDRLFSVLPLHHTYESTIGFLYPFYFGASIAICEGLKYIVSNMKETQPTAILAVPLLIETLYKKINQNIKKSGKEPIVNSVMLLSNTLRTIGIDIRRKAFKDIYDVFGGKLRIIVTAAAPMDKKVAKWFENIGLLMLQGYGLTETAPISALTPQYDTHIGSVGKAVKCAQIKIQDPNEYGEGEVWIKSTTLMLGYYENEEETNKVVKDGWFNSGDIGYLDSTGFLYITGRSKNVIVTANGKNIFPEELEELLNKKEFISECMVYGKGENKDLEVAVEVIPNYEAIKEKQGDNLTDKEIYDLIWNEVKEVNKEVVPYKAIKVLNIKKEPFEKTSTMKIKRYVEMKKIQERDEKEGKKENKKENKKK